MIALVLPHRSWWLASELWLDKSFVTMLNTGWFSKSLRVVPRWSDADHKKMKRDCSLGLFKYTKLMGCVDRVNKEVASARMALGKCPRRFQRQLFLASDFPVVGLVNVRIAFSWLSPDLADGIKVEAGRFGFNRRFQLQLGEAVVRHGINWCKGRSDETFLSRFQELRDNQDDGPHFMPQRIKSVGVGTPSARVPKRCSVEHEYVNSYLEPIPQYEGKRKVDPWSCKRSCAMCVARSKREGELVQCTEGDNQKRRTTADGQRVPQTWWCCNKCKVNLCCEECFGEWNHEHGCAPGATQTVGGVSSC